MDKLDFEIPEEAMELLAFDTTEGPVTVLANVGFRNLDRKDLYPYHLSLFFSTMKETLNGTPTVEEAERMSTIKDYAHEVFNRNHVVPNALFLARSTYIGLLELTWRVREPQEALHIIDSSIKDCVYPLSFFHTIDFDEEWLYADLFE